MSSFISRRKSNVRSRPRREPTSSGDGPPRKPAEHTTKCPACEGWIIEGRDDIVFDFVTREWVHDNGKCRTNDTAGM